MDRQEKKGIWQYQDLLPDVPRCSQITLGEGDTPLKKEKGIFFKCEYENPTGSVKDRGMAFQVSEILTKGGKEAVISSSGNAAISAASYCRLAKIRLHAFVSYHINPAKLQFLKKNLFGQAIRTKKPLSESLRYARKHHFFHLRQSTDENALFGYMTLAFELNKQEKKIEAIFLPVSSGATLVGIALGYLKLGKKLPAFHLVQTKSVHPLAGIFDKNFKKTNKSKADAIVAKYTPLSAKILDFIKKSKGYGWVVSDREIEKAHVWLLAHNLTCSYEGAASLAALWKAEKNGYKFNFPVCLLTGKFYHL